MPIKGSIKPTAPKAAVPAKTGNGKSIQPKKKDGLFTTGLVQRKEHIGSWVHRQPQRAMAARPLVQPKVTIHPANDRYEKEADAVADKVVANQQLSSAQPISKVNVAAQRKCAHCEKEEKELQACFVQRKCASCEEKDAVQTKPSYILQQKINSSDSSPPGRASPDINPLSFVLSNQSTRGSPLPSSTRRHMEQRIGASFSNVRIHTGQSSHAANAAIGARAFTNGAHIHFAPGEFNPHTQRGRHLLAHELVHTVQQGASNQNNSGVIARKASSVSSDINSAPEFISRAAISNSSHNKAPPVQRNATESSCVQCALIDTAVSRIGELLTDLPSITDGLSGAKHWLLEKMRRFASFIPGYTALGVVLGQDPITGAHIERNGRNFIEAALDIIPGGGLLKQKLEDLGAIDRAATWIDGQLETLSGIIANTKSEFDQAWNDLGISSILDGPLNILRNFGGIFERAINNLIAFGTRAAAQLLDMVKEFLLTQLVNFIKEHTNAYELLKVIIGHDPVTQEEVARNGTNILNALLELGGEQGREQRRQMQETGTFQKAADWIDRGILVFGNLYQTIRNNFSLIWDALSIQSLMEPVATFNRIYETFAEPVRQVLAFVADTLRVILTFIKEALMTRLSAWARTVRGYPLITVIIGKDPFTDAVVPRNVQNIIRGFMSLMDGGEEQYRQMEESGAIGRAAARINAAITRLNMTPAAIVQLFIDLWNSFSFNDLANPVAAFQRILARFGEPVARLVAFVIEIVKIVIEIILQVMNFPFDLINNIITRAMAAIESIKRDPIGFLKNLLRAIKQGFIQFFNNILTHLRNGLIGWLMSELQDANVPQPTDFSLRGIITWGLQVLGISMEAIWQKLAAHPRIGPERVARLRSMIDRVEGIWTFIRDVQQRGMAAIWDKIAEQLSNLWNTVMDAVKNWIMERIVNQVTARLLSMLDPTGIMAVINSAIAIYRAVQSFMRYLRQMLEVVNSFVNGVADIAAGNVTTAANYLERTMGRAMPIVIGFLANQVGLSGIGRRIGEMIGAARALVDRALTWLVNRAVDTGFAIFDRLMAMGRSAVGGGGTPQERLNNAVRDAQAALNRFSGTRVGAVVLNPILALIKLRYGLQTLEVVPRGDVWAISGSINPRIEVSSSVLRAPDGTGTGCSPTPPPTSLVVNHLGKNGGFSNGVKAERLTKTNSAGSEPSVGPVGVWNDLNLRRQGGRSFYVKGHLLNGRAGGPGTWENMVPMFQDHNSSYERRVEQYIKAKYDAGCTMYFEAVVDYRRPANPNKQAIMDAEPDAVVKDKLGRIIDAEVYVPSSVSLVVDEIDATTNQRKMNSIIAEVNFDTMPHTQRSHYTVQTKLQSNNVSNHFEREADHIADKVVAGEKRTNHAYSKTGNKVQHKLHDKLNKPKAGADKKDKLTEAIRDQSTRGSPLPKDTRKEMERSMGADLSKVRIHKTEESHKANVAMGARAFTTGADIHFANGEFKPETKSGKHLLAHELVHTVQQGAAPERKEEDRVALTVRNKKQAKISSPVIKDKKDNKADTSLKRDKKGNLVVAESAGKEGSKVSSARKTETKGKLDKKVVKPASKFSNAASSIKEDTLTFKQKVKTKRTPALPKELLKKAKGKKLNKDPVKLPGKEEKKHAKPAAKVNPQSVHLRSAVKSAATLNQLAGNGIAYKADDDKKAAENPVRQAEIKHSTIQANAVLRKAALAANKMLQSVMQVGTVLSLKAVIEKSKIKTNEIAQKAIIASDFNKERAIVKKAAGQASGSINGYHAKVIKEIKAASVKAKADILIAKTVNATGIEAAAALQFPKIDQTYTDAKKDFEGSGRSVGNECYAKQNQRGWNEFISKMKHEDDSLLDGPYTDDIKQAKRDAAIKVGEGYKDGMTKAGTDQAGKIEEGKPNDYKKVGDAKTEMLKGLAQTYDTAQKAIEASEKNGLSQADSTRKSMLSSVHSQHKAAKSQLDTSEKTQTQLTEILAVAQSRQIDLQAAQATEAMELAGTQNIARFVDGFSEFKEVTARMNSPPVALLSAVLIPVEAGIDSGVIAMNGATAKGIQQVGLAIDKTANDTIATTNNANAAAMEEAKVINAKSVDGLKKLQSAAVAALQGILNNNKKTIVSTASQCVTDIQNIKTAFDGALVQIGTDLTNGLKSAAAELKKGLTDTVNNGGGENKSMLATSIQNENEAASKVEPRWKSALKILLVIVVILVIAFVVGPAVIGFIGAAAGGGAFGAAVGAVVGGAILGAASSAVITIGNNLIDGKTWYAGVGHAMLEGAITGAIGGAFGAAGGGIAGKIFGQAAKGIGPALGKFAIQQTLDFAGNIVVEYAGSKMNGQPFSWESVAKGQAMGAGMHISMNGLGSLKNVKGFKTINNVMEGSAKFGEHLGGTARSKFVAAPKVEVNAPAAKMPVEEPTLKEVAPESKPPVAKEEPVKVAATEEAPKPLPKEEIKTTVEETKAVPKEEVKAVPKDETKVAPKEDVKAVPKEELKVAPKDESKITNPDEALTPGGKKQSELPSNLSKEEVELGIVAKESTGDGHHIKVSEKGVISVCSNCTKLETKYSTELQEPKVKQELEDIKAIKDPQEQAKAARNFDRKMENKLLKEYRTARPGSDLTDVQIKEKIREGSRMNPETKLFNKPDDIELTIDKPATFEKEPLKPGEKEAKTKVDEFKPSDFPEEIKTKQDDLIKQREAAQDVRKDFEEGTPEYKDAQVKVSQASEGLGNVASEGVAKVKGFEGDPVNVGAEFRDGKGTFDRVFEKDGKYLVAESKGGKNDLTSREVIIKGEKVRVEQGTKEYFEATCREMMSPNRSPKEQELGALLLSKSQKNEVEYILVQQPVDVHNTLGTVKVKTFKP